MSTITEIQSAVNRCFMDFNDSIEGKIKAVSAFLDQVDQWRDDHAKAYRDALEVNPDLSPAGFDALRNPVKAVVSAF